MELLCLCNQVWVYVSRSSHETSDCRGEDENWSFQTQLDIAEKFRVRYARGAQQQQKKRAAEGAIDKP